MANSEGNLVEYVSMVTLMSREEALFFLEACNWDSQRAISWFFDGGSSSPRWTTGNHAQAPRKRATLEAPPRSSVFSSGESPTYEFPVIVESAESSATPRSTLTPASQSPPLGFKYFRDDLWDSPPSAGKARGMEIEGPENPNHVDQTIDEAGAGNDSSSSPEQSWDVLENTDKILDITLASILEGSSQNKGRNLSGRISSALISSKTELKSPCPGVTENPDAQKVSFLLGFADGTGMPVSFGYHDTIRAIREYIHVLRPNDPRDYRLVTLDSPERQFNDMDQTIKQAGIADSSVIVQKYCNDEEKNQTSRISSMGPRIQRTRIQIRLVDGTCISSSFGYHQQIYDIFKFIDESRPDAPKGYMLLTTGLCPRVLDYEDTIEEAGITSSVLIQEYPLICTKQQESSQGEGQNLSSSISSTRPVLSKTELKSPCPGVTDDPDALVTFLLGFADGSGMTVKFGPQYTIRTIHEYINVLRPNDAKDYRLVTLDTPERRLDDMDQTIQQAAIADSVVVQKYYTDGQRNQSSSVSTSPAASEETLAQGPINSGTHRTMIRIRLADGTFISSSFKCNQPVEAISDFIDELRPDAPNEYRLLTMETHPRVLDMEETIEEAGIAGLVLMQLFD